MKLITLFARREPSTWSPPGQEFCCPAIVAKWTDIVLYQDSGCTTETARYRPCTQRPTRNSRRVILNCHPWSLQWLPDLTSPQ
jgi:hypothetical protein